MLTKLVESTLQKNLKRKTNRKIQVLSSVQADSVFDRTAFGILGATSRDNCNRIIELVKKQSLALDDRICTKARLNLTNSRNRLSAEVAWLPGLSTKRVKAYLTLLRHDIDFYLSSSSNESPLIKANLISAAIEFFNPETSDNDWALWIYELACQVEQIDPEVVCKVINDDRSISGFPKVSDLRHVETEIFERRKYFKEIIKDAIDQLPTTKMLSIITCVVETTSGSGNQHAPTLFNELTHEFETRACSFLDQEAKNVLNLIARAHEAATESEKKIKPILDKLENVVQNWDKKTSPIWISMKALGMEHKQSKNLIHEISKLSTKLFNKNNMMLGQAQRITNLLKNVSTEFPETVVQLNSDVKNSDNLFKEKKQIEYDLQEFSKRVIWKRKTTHQTGTDFILKSNLSISSNKISWRKIHYPFNAITHVRWGGVRHYVNRILTKTTYTVAFGNNNSETDIELDNEKIYFTFIEKLWQAVGIRLLIRLLNTLKSGQEVSFGRTVVRDGGIILAKRRLFGEEAVFYSWNQVRVWTTDGLFHIEAKNDEKIYADLLYIYIPNTHILECAIRMLLKSQGICRLSDVLNDFLKLNYQEAN